MASPWPCGSSRHGAKYKAHSLYASECAFHSGGDADAGFGDGAGRSGVDGCDDAFDPATDGLYAMCRCGYRLSPCPYDVLKVRDKFLSQN